MHTLKETNVNFEHLNFECPSFEFTKSTIFKWFLCMQGSDWLVFSLILLVSPGDSPFASEANNWPYSLFAGRVRDQQASQPGNLQHYNHPTLFRWRALFQNSFCEIM